MQKKKWTLKPINRGSNFFLASADLALSLATYLPTNSTHFRAEAMHWEESQNCKPSHEAAMGINNK